LYLELYIGGEIHSKSILGLPVLNYSFILLSIEGTTHLLNMDGIKYPGVGCLTIEARAIAALIFLSNVTFLFLLSRSPLKNPGNTKALLI